MTNLDAEVVIRFKIKNLMDSEDNLDDWGFDSFEDFVKFLIEEEGLMGVVEDGYKILSITEVRE